MFGGLLVLAMLLVGVWQIAATYENACVATRHAIVAQLGEGPATVPELYARMRRNGSAPLLRGSLYVDLGELVEQRVVRLRYVRDEAAGAPRSVYELTGVAYDGE